jgi:hypothetical protein
LSCSSCPVLDVLSLLSCSGRIFLCFPSWMYCPGCLLWLFCPGCPVPAVLSWLSCPGYRVLAVLSQLACASYPVPAILYTALLTLLS